MGYEQWLLGCERAEKAYLGMIAYGCSPQVARSVLPTCLYTEIGVSANLREWLLILSQRLSVKAHPDMRVIAEMIQGHLRQIAPTVFEER